MRLLNLINAINGSPDAKDAAVRMPDYDVYGMGIKEKLLYAGIAAVLVFTVGYIFYRSILLSALLCPLAMLYPRMKAKSIIDKRKEALNLQFGEMLHSLSSSLSAGKSIEMSFRDALRDLEIQYPDSRTDIINEIKSIMLKISMNETVETVLYDLAERSHLEDIRSFADVFQTCKRTGGNLVEVIRNTSNIINDKMEIKREIQTILAERRFEQKVLNVMPLLLLVMLSTSAWDYISPVYSTVEGRVVMTIAMGLLTSAYFISAKVMDIKV